MLRVNDDQDIAYALAFKIKLDLPTVARLQDLALHHYTCKTSVVSCYKILSMKVLGNTHCNMHMGMSPKSV